MKRVIALLVLSCVLLSGCTITINTPATEETQGTLPTTAQTVPAETVEPETTVATEPVEALPETVTVYLLESSMLFDSGRIAYEYDDDNNIISYTVYTIENQPMYTATFDELDLEGMPSSYSAHGQDYTIAYFEDGKLKEIQDGTGSYTGFQWDYNPRGDVSEKREYYEGILQSAVYYEYENGVLAAAYCENKAGERVYECQVENGLIVKSTYAETEGGHAYLYEYDENGNLISDSIVIDGETWPNTTYTYRTVEVDYSRACYLLEQQKLLFHVS